ncbi:MAG: flagellar type III secretion system protein FliR [candidate division Zixibacteria bacterium HGW-Zixibacteria-1]|nr:MAG: flagellar type III secretion system protein FliR [candidate division Zixibacteria bacterium HGW-Zixibacteria-1]
MFDFLTFGTAKLQVFLLILFRSAGLFLISPILGHKSIPVMVRAGLAIMLAVILIPLVSMDQVPVIESVWLLALLAAKEMLVGFIIGLLFSLLFVGVRMAGNIVGYQIGLIIANVLDPETNSQTSVIGEFWYVMAVLIFLTIDGHHAILSAFSDSYKLVPVGVFNFTGPAGEQLIRVSAYVFTIAVKLAAPVMITLFLTEVALGVVARTVPQMNIFIVGIPVKIGIGLFILAAALPVFRYMIEKTVYFLDGEVTKILYNIGSVS